MSNREANLKAKVKAVNRAHKYAGELYDQLTGIFADFVGDKVEKATGDLMEKVKKRLPVFPCSPGLHVYRHTSNYSLAYTVKTCETAPNANGGYSDVCQHYEVTVYLGRLDNGVLTELTPKQDYRSDYTPEEVLARRESYERARKEMEEFRSALHPFGEHDR